ncbi:fibronectin type III domain-containing protein [Pelagicoccus sp. SDUM812005]|uniref:fibronectin type III domain-containing protein n=1 Tax=Pelagicoccus sp. SDUM812005 TaxID=3041257 RepID=UPI00280EB31C|nr:fibronectin type III domain-containing protein [Pelagicoccus sp. SDUM812005]MDQ8183619.1 fibronectin type III domain-containing protein [Pelagicoccus sp. SDUM812005]
MSSRACRSSSGNSIVMLALLFGAFLAFTANSHANAKLTWQDNSDNEDGFYIERSKNGGSFERIATLPANTTTFEDSDTQAGVRYRYRVQAFNSFGVSGYTNISLFELPILIKYEDWIAQFLSEQIPLDLPLPPPPAEILSLAADTTPKVSVAGLAPQETLSGSQIPNLLCYAHGINPFAPDYTLLAKPSYTVIDGSKVPCIERAVFKYSVGVETTLQGSSDFKTWSNLPLKKTVTRESSLHRWEAIELPRDGQTRFYRLKVSLASQQSH